MMHFPALDYVLWGLAFVLAGAAIYLIRSRHPKIWAVWGLLGWWIAANIAQFIAHFHGLHTYALVQFRTNFVLLALESLLAVQLAAVLLKESPRLAAFYRWALGAVAILFIAYRHHSLALYVPRILETELYCCGAMGLALIVSWMGVVELFNREVDEPWPWIIGGMVLLLTGQVLGFGLQAHYGLRHWEVVSRVQPIGEILGLLCWNWAAFQKAPARWMVRMPLESKKPVSHIWREFEQRRVM